MGALLGMVLLGRAVRATPQRHGTEDSGVADSGAA
jgi:hypothetical protein